MEKPGQRVTDSKIIERPELKTLLRKTIEAIVTAFLWVIWGFFISRVFIILIPGLGACLYG